MDKPKTKQNQQTGRWLGGRRQVDWGGKTAFVLVVMLPLVAAFLLFWVYPIVAAFVNSFTLWRGFHAEQPFIGLGNYMRAFQDPIFTRALANTFAFVAMSLPLGVVGGLLIALMVNAAGGLRDVFRVIYFIPVVTSTIASAFVWLYLYQPQIGLFNQILNMVNLPSQRWLLSIGQALPAIVVFTTWQGLGFTMVLFLAGLTAIDRTYYDAAKVDGANNWQVFWGITLPLLRPTLTFVTVTGVINGLQIFGPVFIMTSIGDSPPGGPANSTMLVVVYQWLTAFRELELGYGAAMGIILLVIILILTLIQLRGLRTRWEY